MDKYFMWIHYERLHNHNKAKHNKTVCIFLGIYCNFMDNEDLLKDPARQVPSYMNSFSESLYNRHTVYPKKYAHGFVVLCFVVVMQSFIINSHEVFIHIHQGCFAGTGAIVWLPQCQWSKPDGYGKISQCITTIKHSKAKTVCIFLGIYCTWIRSLKACIMCIAFLPSDDYSSNGAWMIHINCSYLEPCAPGNKVCTSRFDSVSHWPIKIQQRYSRAHQLSAVFHPVNQPGTESRIDLQDHQKDCQQNVPYKGNWSVDYYIFYVNSVDGRLRLPASDILDLGEYVDGLVQGCGNSVSNTDMIIICLESSMHNRDKNNLWPQVLYSGKS